MATKPPTSLYSSKIYQFWPSTSTEGPGNLFSASLPTATPQPALWKNSLPPFLVATNWNFNLENKKMPEFNGHFVRQWSSFLIFLLYVWYMVYLWYMFMHIMCFFGTQIQHSWERIAAMPLCSYCEVSPHHIPSISSVPRKKKKMFGLVIANLRS